jgi:hypothetical protein
MGCARIWLVATASDRPSRRIRRPRTPFGLLIALAVICACGRAQVAYPDDFVVVKKPAAGATKEVQAPNVNLASPHRPFLRVSLPDQAGLDSEAHCTYGKAVAFVWMGYEEGPAAEGHAKASPNTAAQPVANDRWTGAVLFSNSKGMRLAQYDLASQGEHMYLRVHWPDGDQESLEKAHQLVQHIIRSVRQEGAVVR